MNTRAAGERQLPGTTKAQSRIRLYKPTLDKPMLAKHINT
jgi:hypothetical protein